MTGARARRTALVLATLSAGAGCSTSAGEMDSARAPGWYEAADMHVPREHPALLKLADGQVFAAGGHWLTLPPEGLDGGSPWRTAEIYDPEQDSWHLTDALGVGRGYATAVESAPGRVLLAGGFSGEQSAAVEILDVASGRWTEAPPLSTARQDFTLDVLPDGHVVAVGGFTWDSEEPLTVVEAFDPDEGDWTAVDDLPEARSGHATYLGENTLHVVGGCADADACSVLHLDLASLTWTVGANLPTTTGAVVSLGDGQFLSNGGRDDEGTALTSTSRFSVDGELESTGDMAVPRSLHWLTTLPDGRVVTTGGSTTSAYETVSSVELWDPATGEWTPDEPMAVRRQGHRAVVLDDGDLLVVGGYNHDDFTQLATCERLVPAEP